MPENPGLAFVVILHLSPDHDSELADILQRSTSLRVLQVRETCKVQVNTVYVIPPGKALRTYDGFLQLADLPSPRHGHVTVDLFFRMLADTHGPHATAIVLSGMDGDGAIGIPHGMATEAALRDVLIFVRTRTRRTEATGCDARSARWCCSRCVTCSRIRRSRGWTSSPAATC